MKIVFLSLTFVLLFTNCSEWGWQDVTSEYEPVLNIFALISLDTTMQSFVEVNRTLRLDEGEWTVYTDTVRYEMGSDDFRVMNELVPNYHILDATVTISDRKEGYHFYFSKDHYRNSRYEDALYLDTLGLLQPKPNTTYNLSVSTPNGLNLTGVLTTPPLPQINVEEIPDTVYHRHSYTVSWQPLEGVNTIIVITSMKDRYACGANQWTVIDRGTSTWTSEVVDCGYLEDVGCDSIMIQLYSIDENYHDYFISHYDQDFLSLLLGKGDTGMAYGVEGGLGIFGAIAGDRIYRVFCMN